MPALGLLPRLSLRSSYHAGSSQSRMIASTHGSTSSAVGKIWLTGVSRSGKRQHDAAVAQGLRDAAAVGADDRDAVDHGLDRHQRLRSPTRARASTAILVRRQNRRGSVVTGMIWILG